MKIESAQILGQDNWPQLVKLESVRGRDSTNLGLLELEPWCCLGLKIYWSSKYTQESLRFGSLYAKT